jgi:hypothetical protein
MDDWSLDRANIDKWLEQQPNPQLVFVRYWQNHNINFEWVYNHPDIMHSHVIGARDLGAEHTQTAVEPRTRPHGLASRSRPPPSAARSLCRRQQSSPALCASNGGSTSRTGIGSNYRSLGVYSLSLHGVVSCDPFVGFCTAFRAPTCHPAEESRGNSTAGSSCISLPFPCRSHCIRSKRA